MDRGSNYLVVVNNTGDLSRKWIKDVKLVEACWTGYKQVGTKKKGNRTVPNCVPEEVKEEITEFSYKGYVPKNLNSELIEAFKLAAIDSKDPIAMLNAIKTTDTYLQLHGKIGQNPDINQLKTYKDAHIKATEALQKIGVYDTEEEKPDTKLARNVLTYQDFMKAGKEPVPENTEKYVGEPHTTPGHTLATRQHLRRQKVAYVNEAASVTDGEVEGQVVTKIKPLPPELTPPPDEPGKQRGKGNSAFFEKKNKKVEKEALDYLDLDSWLRQQSQQAHG
jgi:hypothetical protein